MATIAESNISLN